MLYSTTLRFGDIPADTLRYFRSGRSNAASIYDHIQNVYARVFSSYPYDVREGYAEPDPLHDTGVTYNELVEAVRIVAFHNGNTLDETLADMGLPRPVHDLVDLPLRMPVPMEIDDENTVPMGDEHEDWPSEPVFNDPSALFHYQAAHAIRTYGFISIDDFYSHINEGDRISLLYNGATFEYTYRAVHRSDNRGYNVYCADFMGHAMQTQTL